MNDDSRTFYEAIFILTHKPDKISRKKEDKGQLHTDAKIAIPPSNQIKNYLAYNAKSINAINAIICKLINVIHYKQFTKGAPFVFF